MTSVHPGSDRTAVIDKGEPGKRRTRLPKSASLGTLGTATALVFGQATVAIALLLVARRSETDEFGAFIGLYGASLAVGALVDFGSSQYRTRELARGHGLRHFRWWLRRRSMMQIPVVVAGSIIGIALVGDRLPVLCIIGLVAQALTYTMSLGAMSAVRATRTPVLAEWFVGAGNLVLLAVSLFAPSRSLMAAAGVAASGSWLITTCAGLWSTRHLVGGEAGTKGENPWSGGVSFGVSSVSTAIHGFLVGVIGWTSGPHQAALIGAVSKWAQPISLFAAAYASYMFPAFASATSHARAIHLMRPLRVIGGLGAGAAVVLIVIGPWLVDLLLGDEYADAGNILRLLVLAAVPVLAAQPLSALLQARGFEAFVARSFVVVSVTGFVATIGSSFVLGAASIPLFSFLGSTALVLMFGRRTLALAHDGTASERAA